MRTAALVFTTLAAFAAVLGASTESSAQPPRIEVQAVAATGSMPKGVSLSPDGKRAYVTNFGQTNGHNIDIYDADTLAHIDQIDMPGNVVESLLSPDGTTIYASNFIRNSVQLIDVKTKRVTKEIPTGTHPKILVLSPDGKQLFAANWSGDSVTQIDIAKGAVVRTLTAGKNPRGMAMTKAGTLYAANFNGASIDVFSGTAFDSRHRFDACPIPRHLALSPDERLLYQAGAIGLQLVLAAEAQVGEHLATMGDRGERAVVAQQQGEDQGHALLARERPEAVAVQDMADLVAEHAGHLVRAVRLREQLARDHHLAPRQRERVGLVLPDRRHLEVVGRVRRQGGHQAAGDRLHGGPHLGVVEVVLLHVGDRLLAELLLPLGRHEVHGAVDHPEGQRPEHPEQRAAQQEDAGDDDERGDQEAGASLQGRHAVGTPSGAVAGSTPASWPDGSGLALLPDGLGLASQPAGSTHAS